MNSEKINNLEINPTKERFSFREMEHIATNFAITCMKDSTQSFREFYKGVNPDWRNWLKLKDKEKDEKETNN